MKKTKIICTMGPNTNDRELIKQLALNGMDIARFNFSHGDHDEQSGRFALVESVRQELNIPIATLLDTKGPEIRTGALKDDKKVTLKEGQKFTLTTREVIGDETIGHITYAGLPQDIEAGNTILVDDGLIELKVTKVVDGTDIECSVVNGGELGSKKGVNVPNVSIKLPGITEKDKDDIIFGIEKGFDFIAASFVRNAACIQEIKEILWAHDADIPVIAKIENAEGIANIDEIIRVADGIMVARGDMGVEIPIEKVPIIQKKIIRKCNESGKIVITATQMLDSMIRNSLPTRAEACDICNAIFDGTDAIMLSGESASGQYPIEAAKTMSKIAKETELHLDYNYLNQCLKEPAMYDFAEAISYSTCRTSNVLNAKAIVAATNSGSTAKLVSKYKPKCPIVAITPHEEVLRGLSLNFGVYPVLCQEFANTDDILNESKKIVTKMNLANKGDDIIIAAGMPTNYTGGTNMLKIEKI